MDENKSESENIIYIKKFISINIYNATNLIKIKVNKILKMIYSQLVCGNQQNYFYFIFYLFIFSLIVPVCLQKQNIKQIRKLSGKNELNIPYSEIVIKIPIVGNHQIISSRFNLCPNEIYINETKFDENRCDVQLINNNSIIRVIWFNKLTTCKYMFYGITNITEIDLSKFDGSLIKNTNYMFSGCELLKTINLT